MYCIVFFVGLAHQVLRKWYVEREVPSGVEREEYSDNHKREVRVDYRGQDFGKGGWLAGWLAE